MSRMTLLDGNVWLIDGNVWLSLAAPRALSGAGKAGDAGYPPYNIELLPEGERGPEGLRVTLAVAGFSADELDIVRSEERRVGKECYALCRSRWSPYH